MKIKMNKVAQAWDDEYANPKWLTGDQEPQAFTRRFIKWLKQDQNFRLDEKNILDIGTGTGRNAFLFAERGAQVIATDISPRVIDFANSQKSEEMRLQVSFRVGDIRKQLPFTDGKFDLVFDATSSTTLQDDERERFLSEVSRVLKPTGYMFVRALCKDGDKNAKNLIKQFPAGGKDMYINQELQIAERAFTEEDFVATYEHGYSFLHREKVSGYTIIDGQKFKRNYWIAYLKKKV